jgi:hypothetical protein
MQKLSKRHLIVAKLSKRASPDYKKVIKEMRETVKDDPAVIKKFKKYDVPIDDIDDIHIEFRDLDVSAKTKDKKIYLNKKMLDKDHKGKDPTHYLVHEIVHYLQQKTGKNVGENYQDEEYLDKPSEEEAFEAQVDYKKREESPSEAKRYVSNLLDFHGLEGKERKEKKEDLLNEGNDK